MINLVAFQGNLVRSPEFADTRGDTEIINFTIASSRKYKDKEDTTFVDCTAYGKTAENIGKFFDKGDPIAIAGRLSQNNWEDRDGNKRSKIYITVDVFHFVGPTGDKRDSNRGGGGRGSSRSGEGRSSGGRGRGNSNRGSGNRGRSQGQREGNDGRGGSNDYDDEIPF